MAVAGHAYVTAHGQRVPYSLLNIADPSLEGNYSELAIPHRNPRIERLQIAHLLAVASKLAYEHPLVIEDVVMFRQAITHLRPSSPDRLLACLLALRTQGSYYLARSMSIVTGIWSICSVSC